MPPKGCQGRGAEPIADFAAFRGITRLATRLGRQGSDGLFGGWRTGEAQSQIADSQGERGGLRLAGRESWGSLCCKPVESILAQALGQDVSQLAAAEKRALLARLLGRLAHEVRNPLSSLDIHVQLLEEDLAALTPQLRDQLTPRLEIIHGELHRLEGIVERFLRLAGPAGVDLEPVEMRKILTHVCELLRPEAAARDIEISSHVEDSLPPVMADPVRLTQALLNVVINAIQAVERKGRVEVSASVADGRVSVVVSDNGPGIPPEKLASIFDPYFTTKTEGSGLGLWIAQQIVTAHGGNLEARNGASGGAVVTMQLPLKQVEGSGLNSEDAKARSDG